MDIKYEANGGIETFGCANYRTIFFYITKFAVGSFVYLIKDAYKGVLTKIYIKRIRYIEYNRYYNPHCPYPPLYVDLYNSYYNEKELCGYSQAYEIVTEFWERYKASLELKIKNC